MIARTLTVALTAALALGCPVAALAQEGPLTAAEQQQAADAMQRMADLYAAHPELEGVWDEVNRGMGEIMAKSGSALEDERHDEIWAQCHDALAALGLSDDDIEELLSLERGLREDTISWFVVHGSLDASITGVELDKQEHAAAEKQSREAFATRISAIEAFLDGHDIEEGAIESALPAEAMQVQDDFFAASFERSKDDIYALIDQAAASHGIDEATAAEMHDLVGAVFARQDQVFVDFMDEVQEYMHTFIDAGRQAAAPIAILHAPAQPANRKIVLGQAMK